MQAQEKTRKQVGQLAGDLYRNGGLNPTLTTFVSGNGEALQQAATLQAISASRSRAFESAETAAAAAQSLTAAAQDANRAADDAAKTAETRKAEAEGANAAQVQAVAEAKAQRTVLVDQLAQLRNTTVALESARVDELDRQREEARLAAITAAAAQAAPGQSVGAPAAPGGTSQEAAAPRPRPPPRRILPPRRPPHPGRHLHPLQLLHRFQLQLQHQLLPCTRTRTDPTPAPRHHPAARSRPPSRWRWQSRVALLLPVRRHRPRPVLTARAWSRLRSPRPANTCPAQPPSSSRPLRCMCPFPRPGAGDLLVWGSAPGFYHVAIYLGNGQVVQALNPDEGIGVTQLSRMAGMQLYPYAARY